MTRRLSTALAAGSVLALALAACGGDDEGSGDTSASATTSAEESTSESADESAPADESAAGGGGSAEGGTAGVILPDSASSVRWETYDRPYLQEAFEAAGIEADIQNAEGDTARFQSIADGMINAGVDVLLIVSLDSETGSAVIEDATAAGIPVIDYDRPTLGGGAEYYVSFDNVAVGTAIGEGLVQCLSDADTTEGEVVLLNGSPTDNNATLFREGYAAALEEAGYTFAADQAVPDWDNTQAGTIFEQIFTETQGQFVGVAAANDGLGGAAIGVLERNGLAGSIPVTGQDATDEGLQRVLAGTQCMTVYKPTRAEAQAAVELAVALISGDDAAAAEIASGEFEDTEAGTTKPAVLLEPQSIFRDNVTDVIEDEYTTAENLCVGPAAEACTELGIS